MNVIDQEGPITKQKPSLSAYSNDNSFFDKYDDKTFSNYPIMFLVIILVVRASFILSCHGERATFNCTHGFGDN